MFPGMSSSLSSAPGASPPRPLLPKEELIPLIVAQLKEYGMHGIATAIAEMQPASTGGAGASFAASNKLAELCHLGTIVQEGADDVIVRGRAGNDDDDDEDEDEEDDAADDGGPRRKRARGLSLDAGDASPSRKAPDFTMWFTTQHRGAVKGAAFSHDGRYFATASADASIKVLDVERIRATRSASGESGPAVIRTLYDHTGPVNDVAFHPNGTVLASGSDDAHIKLFDLTKGGVKRGFRYFQDSHPIRSISFHPSGDFLLTGTDHECVRIYDIQTFKCFIPTTPNKEELKGPLNMVRFSPRGNVFATAGSDGTIRLYDTISSRLVNTIQAAHGGASVSSISFAKNGRYLLSAGQDSLPRIWDLGSGRVVQTFEGTVHRSNCVGAEFSFNDDFVLSSDEATGSLVCWDSRTGVLLRKYAAGHGAVIRGIATSPLDLFAVTCSDDNRAKLWHAGG
ncbi:WD40-repeat-containing domain protein [Zopfochytrium polystomum]|nr:WD40-repeat-containing domain protein [Zopfochytrium polystomum]